MNNKVFGILLAGGSGKRMGASINKILLNIGGLPCIVRSALALRSFVDELILVGRSEDQDSIRLAMNSSPLKITYRFVPGGASRQDSVFSGIKAIPEKLDKESVVIIHDGARCLLTESTVQAVLKSVEIHGSGVAAIPVTNTLRTAGPDRCAGTTVPREGLFQMQTPQGFMLHEFRHALQKAETDSYQGTDDAEVMLHAGFPVFLAEGSPLNIKLTTQEDLFLAEAYISHQLSPMIRVGHGYDVHRLVDQRRLILCGVDIPYTLGLLGHSDADVAVHALMDALLGAAGLGDIGRLFPDSDPQYKNISSMTLLARVVETLRHEGFRPLNADITIIAQKPKLAPYISLMENNVASVLDIPVSSVNVKATTTESLGFEGRQEGISAHAVCSVQSFPSSAAL